MPEYILFFSLVSGTFFSFHFCLVVETDALLKTEVESFAEALKSTHNAVLLTICAISSLLSVSLLYIIFSVLA